MADTDRIFVILDPTTMEQPSLIMAESIVRRGGTVALHVYCSLDEKLIRVETGDEAEHLIAETKERICDWIERLVAPARLLGASVDTEVEISKDWRKATVAAVARQNCMLAIKGMSKQRRLTRLFRDTSDWRLLRDLGLPCLPRKDGTEPTGTKSAGRDQAPHGE